MASVEFDLDDYELRARSMQGVGPAYWPMPLTPIEAPKGLSALSSISPAENEAPAPQHRPALSAPKTHIMHALIAAHNETERLTNKSAKLFNDQVNKSMAEIDKLSLDKQEALEKEAEAAKARSTWSTLSTVAQYITGAGAISLGFAIGGIPGLCIGGAGVIGLTNRVAQDTHLLQATVAWYTKSEEQQRVITHNIEMGAFFLQMGLGLAGGVGAWQTGALAAAQINGAAITDKTTSLITGASHLMSAGAQVGSRHYDKKIAYLQSQMRDIDTETTLDHQTMYNDSAQMSKMIESAQSQTDEMRRAIQALEVSQD